MSDSILPALCPVCNGSGRSVDPVDSDRCGLCAGYGTVHPRLRERVLAVQAVREGRAEFRTKEAASSEGDH